MRPTLEDAHALIAQLRAGDEENIDVAYQAVFGSELGQVVLAHMAAAGGVGRRYGGAPDLYSVGYHMGGHDAVLETMARAGFDQPSAISMVLTGRLEGSEHERSARPDTDADPYAEPDPEFDT